MFALWLLPRLHLAMAPDRVGGGAAELLDTANGGTGGDDGRAVRSTGPGRAPLVVKSVGRRLWWFVVSEEKPDGYFDVAQLHEVPAVCYSSTSCTTSTIAASTSNDRMYGPGVARRFQRAGGKRSCINVSGLWLEAISGPSWISARL